METIYITLKIHNSDYEAEQIRDEGLFFINIANAVGLDRNSITEIDEHNYKRIIKNINQKYKRNNEKNNKG